MATEHDHLPYPAGLLGPRDPAQKDLLRLLQVVAEPGKHSHGQLERPREGQIVSIGKGGSVGHALVGPSAQSIRSGKDGSQAKRVVSPRRHVRLPGPLRQVDEILDRRLPFAIPEPHVEDCRLGFELTAQIAGQLEKAHGFQRALLKSVVIAHRELDPRTAEDRRRRGSLICPLNRHRDCLPGSAQGFGEPSSQAKALRLKQPDPQLAALVVRPRSHRRPGDGQRSSHGRGISAAQRPIGSHQAPMQSPFGSSLKRRAGEPHLERKRQRPLGVVAQDLQELVLTIADLVAQMALESLVKLRAVILGDRFVRHISNEKMLKPQSRLRTGRVLPHQAF